ncbi:MAG: hypothetical protein KBT87_12670 [Gammaproteobacteria bacterium]|nr:hypothetical protein [Gammaproteobacteria bacterium]MBQ0775522.1 hypothetical protein [Gammaproteobacteria bacterium]
MARILFAWELGEGVGHLVPLRPVLEELVAQGHTILVAATDIRSAQSVLRHLTDVFVQAPMNVDTRFELGRMSEGVADLLTLNGYSDATSLRGRHTAWCALAALLKPDLIIAEHSPGALLMARALSIPAVHAGTGFTLPPEQRPMLFPGFEAAANIPREDQLLHSFNALIAETGGQPLVLLADLYNRVAKRFLLTFAELDQLGPRRGVNYLGADVPTQGEIPSWPDGGSKVFAYLKPFPALEQFLDAATSLKISLLMVPDRINPAILKKYQASNIRFVTQRQSMQAIIESADLIAFNGNHGTATAGLLGGVPMLAFPLHQEQEACTRRLADSNLGIGMLRNRPGKVQPLMESLLNNTQQKENSLAVAQQYKKFRYQNSIDWMLNELSELL